MPGCWSDVVFRDHGPGARPSDPRRTTDQRGARPRRFRWNMRRLGCGSALRAASTLRLVSGLRATRQRTDPRGQGRIAVLTCGEAEGKAKLSPPPRSQVEHLVPAHIVRRNKVLDEVSTAIPRDRVARNVEVTCERERTRLTDWLTLSIA